MLLLPDDDNDDAHYGCIAVAAAAAAIAAIIAHHNISSGVYASLLAYFGYTDFFSSTLLFAHVILLTSHTHTVRSWRTMEQKRRFCCRATAIYRADEWSQLPQLLGWLSNLSKRVVVTALTKVIATLLICTSESAQKISDYFFCTAGGNYITSTE